LDEGAVLLHVDITAVVPARAYDEGPVPESSRATLLPMALGLPGLLNAKLIPPAEENLITASAERLVKPTAEALTLRQQQILQLLATGKTNGQIAETLAVSPNTVRAHVSAILKRLGLASRTEAAIYRLSR